MKKLMIIAAVALAAICSQAATVRWSASGVMDATKKNQYSGSATLFAITYGDTRETLTVATLDMTDGAIAATAVGDGVLDAAKYDFYYTMTDASGNTFNSGIKTISVQSKTTLPVGFSSQGSWSSVPEPTSGLLMLLGVAGLALRRRRA